MLTVTVANLWQLTDDCRNGNGRFYLGTMNVTKSGIPCQRWDTQHPHRHIQPPLVFPQLIEGENYCRNAGGEEPQPWCYTLDESLRWQHCEIPICRELCHPLVISMSNLTFAIYSRLCGPQCQGFEYAH